MIEFVADAAWVKLPRTVPGTSVVEKAEVLVRIVGSSRARREIVNASDGAFAFTVRMDLLVCTPALGRRKLFPAA